MESKVLKFVNLYHLCPTCYKEDREQIINPDEEFCPSYGCKIDWDLVIEVEETELDEDVLLEQTFQPIGDDDFTEEELMQMPEDDNDKAGEYLDAIQEKGRTNYNLIKNYYIKKEEHGS